MKRARVIQVVERWCGRRPARGSDSLQDLWEQHGPSGIPFDDEGAELLIRQLDAEFPGHRLRPLDVLGLTFDGLVDAVPDSVVVELPAAMFDLQGADREISKAAAPAVVALADETIERLATRIAERLRQAKSPTGRPASSAKRSPRSRKAKRSAKKSSKGGRGKVR